MVEQGQDIQGKVKHLKDYQQIILEEILNKFLTNNQVDINEILSNHKVCKFCESKYLANNGSSNGIKRYKCRDCGKTQSIFTNTPLNRLQKKEKWVDFIYLMLSAKKVITCDEIRKKLKINIKTAHTWRHKFLAALNNVKPIELHDEVELDEVYIKFCRKGYVGAEKYDNYEFYNKAVCVPSKLQLKENDMMDKSYNSIFMCIHNRRGDFDFIPLRIQKKGAVSNKVLKSALKDLDLSGKVAITDMGRPMAHYMKHRPDITHIAFKSKDKAMGLNNNDVAHNNNINNVMSHYRNWSKDFFGYSTKYQWNYLKWFRFTRLFNDIEVKDMTKLSLSDNKSYERYSNIFTYYKDYIAA